MFAADEQTALARAYAGRYRRLMSRIRHLRLPSTRRLAVTLETRRPETAASTVSLASSRSSILESVNGGGGGDGANDGDMESELASVASETTRRNVERLGTRSEILGERDVLSELVAAATAAHNKNERLAHVPLDEIRTCVEAASLEPLAVVYAHYANVPPQTLETAKSDAYDVKTRVKRLSRQRADILALAEHADDAQERKQLRKLASELSRQKHVAKVSAAFTCAFRFVKQASKQTQPIFSLYLFIEIFCSNFIKILSAKSSPSSSFVAIIRKL